MAAVFLLVATLATLATLASNAAAAQGWRSADAEERWVGEPISMSLKNADLVETLRSFARIGGFNLIVQPGIQGSVTVELKEVPWDQALDAILRTHGLGLDVSGGTLRVASLEQLTEEAVNAEFYGTGALLRTQSIEGQLQHVDAGRIARLLRDDDYLSPYGRAEVRTDNVLRLTERLGRVRRVAELVHALDREDLADADRQALASAAREAWRASSRR